MGITAVLAAAAAVSGQAVQWSVREFLPGVFAPDEGVEIREGSQGGVRYVYVTGYVTNAFGGTAIATYRFNAANPALDPKEAFYPPHPEHLTTTRRHRATGIDVDGQTSEVYVVGEWQTESGTYDYVTIKYGFDLLWNTPPAGERWAPDGARFYNGPGNGDDKPVDVGVLRSSNDPPLPQVVVTGTSLGVGTGFDIQTLKYDIAGNFSAEWPASGPDPQGQRRYNGPGNGDDSAAELSLQKVVEQVGGLAQINVWVAGTEWAGSVRRNDVATLYYHFDGVLTWAQHYNGPASGDDIGTGISPRHQGGTARVVVSGYTPQWTPPEQFNRSGGGNSNSLTPLPDTDYLLLTYSEFFGVPFWSDLGWGPGARVWSGPAGSGVSDDKAWDVDSWAPDPNPLDLSWATATGQARKNTHFEAGTVVFDLKNASGALVSESVLGWPTSDEVGMAVQVGAAGRVVIADSNATSNGNYVDYVLLRYPNETATLDWLFTHTGNPLNGNGRCVWMSLSVVDILAAGKTGLVGTGLDNLIYRIFP